MNPRRIALLAALGLTPIVIAVAVAVVDVSGANASTVLSIAAAYAGDEGGQQSVVALVPADALPRLRPGQSAQVYVASLDLRLSGHLTAVAVNDEPLPAGLDPAWFGGRWTSDRAGLAWVVVALDVADARLAPGGAAGVRISVSGG